MNEVTFFDGLPAEVLDDVASVVGAEVTLLGRLPGGANAGGLRVQLAGKTYAVLKAEPRAHPKHLDETLRAQRVVEHMRRRGYPTPAWHGVGATASHVWHLMDFVDAAPAPELTPFLVEQLMEIIELQGGRARLSRPRRARRASLAVAGGDGVRNRRTWSYFTSERRRNSSPKTSGSTIQIAVVEPSMAHSLAVSVPPSNSATCV